MRHQARVICGSSKNGGKSFPNYPCKTWNNDGLVANEMTRTMSDNHFVSAHEDKRTFSSSVTRPRGRVNIHFINRQCLTTATTVTFQHSQSSSVLLFESAMNNYTSYYTGIPFSPSISINALILGFNVGIEMSSAGELLQQRRWLDCWSLGFHRTTAFLFQKTMLKWAPLNHPICTVPLVWKCWNGCSGVGWEGGWKNKLNLYNVIGLEAILRPLVLADSIWVGHTSRLHRHTGTTAPTPHGPHWWKCPMAQRSGVTFHFPWRSWMKSTQDVCAFFHLTPTRLGTKLKT